MTAPGTASEFARIVALDTVGETARRFEIAATAEERAALARRFDLEALDRLEAAVDLRRAGTTIHAGGRIRAVLAQRCVATAEPVPAALDQPFALRFVPEGEIAAQDEVELSDEDCDTLPYEGGAIDLGEAVAETMALALDPFPRGPNADAALKAAGVKSEDDEVTEAGPFASLRGLFKD